MIASKSCDSSPPSEDTATLAELLSKEAEGVHKGSQPLISLKKEILKTICKTNNFKSSTELPLTMIKTYLFDLDDTLIDTSIYARLYPKIISLIERKKTLKGAELDMKAISFGLKKNKFGRWDTGDLCGGLGLLEEYYAELETAIEIESVLHDTVEGIFAKLKKKGMKIGIVSNSMQRTIQAYLTKYKLAKYVDFIFSSEDAGCRKDNDLYWKKLIEKQQLKPQECLMVGDDELEDVQIPAKFGFKTFLIQKPVDLEKVI